MRASEKLAWELLGLSILLNIVLPFMYQLEVDRWRNEAYASQRELATSQRELESLKTPQIIILEQTQVSYERISENTYRLAVNVTCINTGSTPAIDAYLRVHLETGAGGSKSLGSLQPKQLYEFSIVLYPTQDDFVSYEISIEHS